MNAHDLQLCQVQLPGGRPGVGVIPRRWQALAEVDKLAFEPLGESRDW